MSQELHYTSAPRGLQAGSRGFCTVATTPQMAGTLVERLESLSGYRQVFPPHDPSAGRNPVALAHLKVTAAGGPRSVLSRVGPAGLDYTDRANKYAHHVVLDAAELPAGGPAWLLGQPGFLQATWEGEPGLLAAGRRVPAGDRPPGIAQAWLDRVGDAGWAGVLAEAFLADPKRPAYLVFEPGMDLLPLVAEAIALLPPARRWDVTFSTYFTGLPQGIPCAWRCVLLDSAEAAQARRLPDGLVLDLTSPLGRAEGGDLVRQARTGEPPEVLHGIDDRPNEARSRIAEEATDWIVPPPGPIAPDRPLMGDEPSRGSPATPPGLPATRSRRLWRRLAFAAAFLLAGLATTLAVLWWQWHAGRPVTPDLVVAKSRNEGNKEVPKRRESPTAVPSNSVSASATSPAPKEQSPVPMPPTHLPEEKRTAVVEADPNADKPAVTPPKPSALLDRKPPNPEIVREFLIFPPTSILDSSKPTDSFKRVLDDASKCTLEGKGLADEKFSELSLAFVPDDESRTLTVRDRPGGGGRPAADQNPYVTFKLDNENNKVSVTYAPPPRINGLDGKRRQALRECVVTANYAGQSQVHFVFVDKFEMKDSLALHAGPQVIPWATSGKAAPSFLRQVLLRDCRIQPAQGRTLDLGKSTTQLNKFEQLANKNKIKVTVELVCGAKWGWRSH